MTPLTAAMLAQIAATPGCAASAPPWIAPEKWAGQLLAIVQVESHGDPYAVRDDTADASYYPATLADAERIAANLIAQGHRIGVGLMQLSPPSRFGLSVRDALDPCRNMRAGSELQASNLKIERASFCRFNSGHPNCGNSYPARVERALAALPPIPLREAASRPDPPPLLDDWNVFDRSKRSSVFISR